MDGRQVLLQAFSEHYGDTFPCQHPVMELSLVMRNVDFEFHLRVPADCTLIRLHTCIKTVLRWKIPSVHGFFQPDGDALGILFPECNLCATQSDIVSYIHELEWDIGVLNLISLLQGLLYVTKNGEYWEFGIHLLRVEAYASDSFPQCTEQMGEAPPECIKALEDYDAFLSALESPEAPGNQKLLSWARAQGWKTVDLDEINERLKIL